MVANVGTLVLYDHLTMLGCERCGQIDRAKERKWGVDLCGANDALTIFDGCGPKTCKFYSLTNYTSYDHQHTNRVRTNNNGYP